jgi:hypothetical protein
MSKKPVGPMRQRLIDDITARRFSEDTKRDYVGNVRKCAAFLGRSPDTTTSDDLRRYQLHMAQRQISPWSINSAIAALRFFFTVTLERPDLVRDRAAQGSGCAEPRGGGAPHRSRRALRGLRARTHRLQFLPQPALPEAPGAAAGDGSKTARRSCCRFPTTTSSSPCRPRSARFLRQEAVRRAAGRAGLSRPLHRVAISNSRLTALDDKGNVRSLEVERTVRRA